MFRALVHQRLVTADASDTLTRDVQLPFTPFPGLDLDGISRSEDGLKVAAVAWDVEEGCFLAFLEQHVSDRDTLASALGFYGEGWTFTPDEPGPQTRGPNGLPGR